MSEVESNNRTLKFVSVIGAVVLLVASYFAYDYYKSRIDAEVEVQKEVQLEKARIDAAVAKEVGLEAERIEQEAKTQRTRERMHWVPWYKDDENKGAETK